LRGEYAMIGDKSTMLVSANDTELCRRGKEVKKQRFKGPEMPWPLDNTR
jgi:hypothetical protein